MTKNQEEACEQLDKALARISRCNLVVVMSDGSANVHTYKNYEKANSQDSIDCGMYGIKVDSEVPEHYRLGLGVIIH